MLREGAGTAKKGSYELRFRYHFVAAVGGDCSPEPTGSQGEAVRTHPQYSKRARIANAARKLLRRARGSHTMAHAPLLFSLPPCLLVSAAAQPAGAHAPCRRHHPGAARVAAFDAAYQLGPLPLHAFLAGMPKGADLHMHLSGAVYAETFLRDAARGQRCASTRCT